MSKSKGPSIEPWGIPFFKVDHCENTPGNGTLCFPTIQIISKPLKNRMCYIGICEL